MRWYLKALRQYADFTGRARRTEFWMFMLVSLGIVIVLAIIQNLFGWHGGARTTEISGHAVGAGGPLTLIYNLATVIPTIAVSVRRLHDIGRSGWWWLLTFVSALLLLVSMVALFVTGSWWPWIPALLALGANILVFVWWVLPGQRGHNKYGPDPKAGLRPYR
ncbi:MAG TPA: DUF805 domain-containing protein [Pseudonocardia sp.]|jgi:uncharacterized membrane protein YhaH (DUF805 family)